MITINTSAGTRVVSSQFLADTLTTGVEGAIGYWCSVERYVHTSGPEYTEAVILEDEERGESHKIDLEVIRLGFERILSQEDPGEPPANNAFANWSMIYRWARDGVADDDASIIDADVADAVIQYGLFGKQVYG